MKSPINIVKSTYLNMIKYPNNIRMYRKKYGMTQTELAKRLNISPSYLSILENGLRLPSYDLRKRICEVFYSTPKAIFGINPREENENDKSRTI